jgi:hypothetical protein
VIVRGDLDRKPHALANILNKRVAGPPIAFSNLVRNNKLCVGVDATPKPESESGDQGNPGGVLVLCAPVTPPVPLQFCLGLLKWRPQIGFLDYLVC